jgi:dolichol-phosphate mannosyltransferase
MEASTEGTAQGGRPHLSVVVPTYCCHECLEELHRRLVASLSTITPDFEIVIVNDGSPQADWQVLRRIAEGDARIKAISLSRNFGQHYAIAAGLDHAEGDWVVVMDCDLQDAPEDIPRLYRRAQEGFDVVFARRLRKRFSRFKRLTSWAFSRFLGFLMGAQLDSSVANFSIISRQVALQLRTFKERNRTYALFVRWLGFEAGFIDVEHRDRFAGETTYSLGKMVGLATEAVISQSDKPLRLSIQFGAGVSAFAFAYGVYQLVRTLVWGIAVPGWTSVIVSLYFIGGLLFMNLGVVGLYVGKIFDETRRRPLYVVSHTVNVDRPGTEPDEPRARRGTSPRP